MTIILVLLTLVVFIVLGLVKSSRRKAATAEQALPEDHPTPIVRGGKALPQIAPLSGTIVGVNNKLASSPGVVNSSPLEKGWIVRLAPAQLTVELRNLLKGAIADRWQEAVINQLVRWFTSPLHPVLQDGGQIIDNVSDLMDDADWQRFVQEFFSIEATYRNNNLTNQRS
ncbi:MAG: hypothetical protein NTZ35_04895 [Ignavibacteriales bacterium]|nr:hypothetical protein [Ignavibacteriales bacterium]